MNKLIFIFLVFGLAAIAQPPITGSNPTISCTNCPLAGGGPYHIGNSEVTTGSGAPGLVTGSAAGDFYIDTFAHQAYQCFNPSGSCTSVATGQWQAVANAASLQYVSVTVFGVNGNPSTDQGNFQTALNTMAGVGCLYIPSGVTVMAGANSYPPYTCIKGDGNNKSIINSTGLTTPGFGVVDVSAGGCKIDIGGIFFEGGVTSPTPYTYTQASTNGPNWANFKNGSTVWLHGGLGTCGPIKFHDNVVNHTAGYAFYGDADTGPGQYVELRNNIIQNSRNTLFGVSSGTAFYGSWTGGVLFQSNGTSYNWMHVVMDSNTCQNVTGNCFWTHSTGLVLQNYDLQITNNVCIDHGLDCTQPNMTDHVVTSGNRSIRGGFVVTSDVGASRVGGPMWDQSGSCPSMFDGGIGVTDEVRTGNIATGFNGCFMDLDGQSRSTISNNQGTSCFWPTTDPLVTPSTCGPYLSGSPVTPGSNNYTKGITTNNSQSVAGGDTGMTITDNQILGVGTAGIGAFGLQNSYISGNTINSGSTGYQNPIVLGNIPIAHATGNVVTKNNCFWTPASSGGCITQDQNTFSTPFSSSDNNNVISNKIGPPGTLMYEFQKCAGIGSCGAADASASGTGPLRLSSVTAGADSVTDTVLQTEGPTANPTLAVYANNGSGYNSMRLNSGGVLIGPVTTLPNPISYPQFAIACSTCTPNTNPCSYSGTGAWAYSNGLTWNCVGGGSGGSGITGSATAGHLAVGTGSTSIGPGTSYESSGTLITPNGIISLSGIQAPGFNPTGFTGASAQIQVGCALSAGVCASIYFAVPGAGAQPCPLGGPSNCTYYSAFTVHGGAITGLP